MRLYIDTTNSEKIKVQIGDDIYENDARKERSQILLPLILNKLKNKKRSLNDISKIEVNTGPGSFTGIRVGVTVACCLGWALGITVNGLQMKSGKMLELKYQ